MQTYQGIVMSTTGQLIQIQPISGPVADRYLNRSIVNANVANSQLSSSAWTNLQPGARVSFWIAPDVNGLPTGIVVALVSPAPPLAPLYTSPGQTLTANAGQTLSATQVFGGILDRAGSPQTTFVDTTASAAQLVAQWFPNGYGGAYLIWWYANNTSQPATLASGTGVTIAGSLGATTAPGAVSQWLVLFESATAVNFNRVG